MVAEDGGDGWHAGDHELDVCFDDAAVGVNMRGGVLGRNE